MKHSSLIAIAVIVSLGCGGPNPVIDGGTAGGSAGGTAGGTAGGSGGGTAGGTAGGSAGGTAGGSAGGTAGGSAGGTAGGSAGGTAGGTAGGSAGGSAGGGTVDAGIDPGAGDAGCWVAPVRISPTNATVVKYDFAVDGTGRALALWTQPSSNGGSDLYVSQSTATTAWSAPTPLALDGGNVVGAAQTGVTLVANEPGAAVAIWQEQLNGLGQFNVWAARYAVATGWAPLDRVTTVNSAATDYPGAGIDGAGNIFVAFSQPLMPAGSSIVWVRRFDAATSTWSNLQRVSPSTGNTNATASTIAVSPTGAAVVAYTYGSDVRGATYQADGGWLDGIIDGTAFNVAEPDAAAGASGDIVVTWRQYRGSGAEWDVAATRLHAGAWSAAATLDFPDAGHATTPRAAVDGQGQAVVVWSQATDLPVIYSANLSYFDGASWSPPRPLASWTSSPIDWANAALNANGVGTLTWRKGSLGAARVGVPFSISPDVTLAGAGNVADLPPRLGVTPAGVRWAVFPAYQTGIAARGLISTHCP